MGIKDSFAFRRFLRGDLPQAEDVKDDNIRRWRASIPYTNAQIVRVLHQMADDINVENPFLADRYRKTAVSVALGHLSGRILRLAIGRLLTTCVVCEKKALYRKGQSGFCMTHKDVKDPYATRKAQRIEAKSSDFEKEHRDLDARLVHSKARSRVRKPRLKG